jgi:hypothetical protein
MKAHLIWLENTSKAPNYDRGFLEINHVLHRKVYGKFDKILEEIYYIKHIFEI